MTDTLETTDTATLDPARREMYEKVLAKLNPDRFRDLLVDLVNIHSPTGRERPASEYMASYLQDKVGIGARYQPISEHTGNAIGELPGSGGGSRLLLYAPIDTHIDPEADVPWVGKSLRPDMVPEAKVDGDLVIGLGASNPRDVADRVVAEGIDVEWVDTGSPEERLAVAAFRFTDADGFPNEVVFGPTIDHTPLAGGGVISGFVTGELGLGHVVLMCKDYPAAVDFYTRVLGFRLTDYIVWDGADATFLHCNPRHHSLALMNECFSFTGGDFNHLMIEVASLDDVGRAYDLVTGAGIALQMTFGRHTNDGVTSFYMRTPSGFAIEIGYGGDTIDSDDWEVKTFRSPSRWGHEPQKVG